MVAKKMITSHFQSNIMTDSSQRPCWLRSMHHIAKEVLRLFQNISRTETAMLTGHCRPASSSSCSNSPS